MPNVLNKSGMTKLRLRIMTLIVLRSSLIQDHRQLRTNLQHGGAEASEEGGTLSRRRAGSATLLQQSSASSSSVFVVWQRNMERRLRAGLHFGETTRPYSDARPTRSK